MVVNQQTDDEKGSQTQAWIQIAGYKDDWWVLGPFFGPEVGRRHDLFLYVESNVVQFLSDVFYIARTQYVSYEDAGFSMRPF